MCSFLTVGIEGSRSAALEASLVALRLEVGREVNPQVQRLFPAGDTLFMVTRGDCSCDLVPLKADSPREEKRRRRGQSGSKRPNQISDTFFESLKTHAPVRLYFHEVAGNQFTEAVKEDAQATLIS